MRLLVRCMSRRAFMSVRICLHWEPPLTVGDSELANHFASAHNIQFLIVNTPIIINPHICVRIQRVLFQVHKAANIITSSRKGGVILSTPPSVLSPELVLSDNRRFDHRKKDHWIRRKNRSWSIRNNLVQPETFKWVAVWAILLIWYQWVLVKLQTLNRLWMGRIK